MAVKNKGAAGPIPLATLHPMPQLKLAVVGVVDGREAEMAARLGVSGDKLSRMASVYSSASLKHGKCLFCGKALAVSFKQAAKLGWVHLAPVLCPCLAKVRTGYREYIANWQQQVAMIAAKVEAREMDPATPVYSNQCRDGGPSCEGTFVVLAGDVARNVRKHGNHEKWTRCASCRKAHQVRASQKPTAHQKKYTHKSKNAAPKGRPHQKFNAPLKASVGERLEQQYQMSPEEVRHVEGLFGIELDKETLATGGHLQHDDKKAQG